MKRPVLIIAALSFVALSYGQSTFKRNNIHLELGGNGLWTSLNYERQLTSEPGLGIRVGVGFYTENAFYLTIPVGINYLFKLKGNRSFIDAGLGATWAGIPSSPTAALKDTRGSYFMNIVPSIGYRRETRDNLMWRVSLTPVANKFGLVPWFGISIGKGF